MQLFPYPFYQRPGAKHAQPRAEAQQFALQLKIQYYAYAEDLARAIIAEHLLGMVQGFGNYVGRILIIHPEYHFAILLSRRFGYADGIVIVSGKIDGGIFAVGFLVFGNVLQPVQRQIEQHAPALVRYAKHEPTVAVLLQQIGAEAKTIGLPALNDW